MSRKDEMAGIARLAGVVSDAAQARLAAQLRRIEELRTSLAALEGKRRSRALELTEPDAALLGGADLRWHRWIDGRRAMLNAELARALAEAGRARAALVQAFGRKLASEALAREASAERARLAARRAERDQAS